MRNDSSLNYNTSNSRVQNFKDFEENIRREKEDLKKLLRGYKKNVDGDNLPNTDSDKLHFNNITHKMDNNIGKEIVDDSIDELEDVEDSDHKYKIVDEKKVKTYETFMMSKNVSDSCLDCGCVDCNCNSSQSSYKNSSDMENDTYTTSYMFFGNLQTIHRLCSEMAQMDESKVNSMLDDGHNWAEDHITTAKVQVSQVYNFLMNKSIKENHDYNYMFFANLERMMEQAEDLLNLDENMVDDILKNGHDWAEDHISSAKENVEQVHDFLTNEME